MPQNKLVVVQSYGTEGEAAVAKGVLESSGLEAMIQADTAGRMREHLARSGLGHRLLVREEDAAAARSILDLPQSGELELLQRYGNGYQADIPQGALLSASIFATVRYDGMYYVRLDIREPTVRPVAVQQSLAGKLAHSGIVMVTSKLS